MAQPRSSSAVVTLGLVLIAAGTSPAFGRCGSSLPINMCATAGMSIVGTTTNSHLLDPIHGIGGSFWQAGRGDRRPDKGKDSGLGSGFAVDPFPGNPTSWLSDYIVGDGSSGERCFLFDWAHHGVDGCGHPADPDDVYVAVITDTNNNYAVLSVAGLGGIIDWDMILLGSGDTGMIPNAFGSSGIPLTRAVSVASSSETIAGKLTMTVNPLGFNYFDELGGARAPTADALHADLYGVVDGRWRALGTGRAGGVVVVDADTMLCWGFTTGEFVPGFWTDHRGRGSLGISCVRAGGLIPSQTVDRAVMGAAEDGGTLFEWHVTAQFDLLGFHVARIDPTRGTSVRLNDSPILEGQNDGTDQSYSAWFPRRTGRLLGAYELQMVRDDGSVTETPFTRRRDLHNQTLSD